jgi:hypothetical protein
MTGSTADAGEFIDEFRRSIASAVQNTERGQLLDVLSDAVRIVVDPAMVRRVFETVSETPNLVERNLDLIGLPHAPATWIEIDDRARRDAAAGLEGPSRIGFLLSPHPADPGVLVAAIARQIPERADGACHLMPAFCAINLAVLSDLAAAARHHLSTTPKESVARMVMSLMTYVPPGFTPEIDEFAKVAANVDSDRLHAESRVETAGEGVFLLALLVFLLARNVAYAAGEDGVRTASVVPERPGRLRRALAALRLRATPSVERSRSGGRPVVALVDV